ncbi:uncharacterized protein BP5553_05374 [Venustampulla echinocandica]|uniref:RING finger domain-containing protein n=1 Tax=Venustampulla echinocandica TaxID=2656787 RepID=A0A370TQZ1_9HELO|nr:uncharacterized protein BP5553_05374 [Venustampulla echinocandica]RDL37941.1 hypothetical protein BP5553_05374 [Venustampulla echinocandica]
MANRDSIPPPPYSLTDSFTDAGASQYISPAPASSRADNASVAGHDNQPPSAAPSTVESVIYTPVSSPPESVHQQVGFDDSFSHLSSSAAAVYFESRPVRNRSSGQPITHSISLNETTQPQDLPYPEDWTSKEVNQQDWATFINYLLPDHTASVNNDVADRKLKAELIAEQMYRLALSEEEKSKTDISQVDAQLRPLRQFSASSRTESLIAAEATIAEWNEHFFQPRGITIVTSELNPPTKAGDETPRVPGAWIPYDHELVPNPSSKKGAGQRGMFDAFKRFPGVQAGSQGFRMGPIVADSDGFRIGSALVADNNGFRMGNVLVADQNGFRLGGARGIVADSSGFTMGGRQFGRKESYDSHDKGRGRGGRRGGPRARSVSTSSSKSSSSFSSAHSDSSVGSLPDYDDLKPPQLPVAKRALLDWVNHPEHPITKDDVQKVRHEIKLSRAASSQQSEQDVEALRREVRDLMKAFREARKTQKRLRRESRRERRAARRAQKKGRRSARKEERRARREGKKSCNSNAEKSGCYFPTPTAEPSMSPHPFPVVETPSMPRGFPFERAPFLQDNMPPHSPESRGPPGMAAIHGAWPFTQELPYAPGRISVPFGSDPTPVSRGSEQIHAQALQMRIVADKTEAKAVEIRIASLADGLGEKERLQITEEAIMLEEEADNCRREADKLMAEATLLDSELARELEEENEHMDQNNGAAHH